MDIIKLRRGNELLNQIKDLENAVERIETSVSKNSDKDIKINDTTITNGTSTLPKRYFDIFVQLIIDKLQTDINALQKELDEL